MASDADIIAKLESLLEVADITVTTERMLRQKLEKHFGVDLTEKKNLIREQVTKFIERITEEAENAKSDDDNLAEASEEDEEEEESDDDTGGAILSEALQQFLGKTSMRRTAVVKELWAYIKANNLQDPKNKKNIILDEKLSTVFTPPLNMLNMNRQLNKHVKGGLGPSKRKSSQKGKKAKKAKVDGEDAPKRPSNFSKPLKLSKELADFLGQEEASRGEITKRFWEYFKENNLQDPSDKRWIIADDKLKELLGSDRFQGFSLSKLVQVHIKP